MKVIYIDRVESKTAFSSKMYCPNCGCHGYEIIEQLSPPTELPWRIRCESCGYETDECYYRDFAIRHWKQS